MCGRFAVYSAKEIITKAFKLDSSLELDIEPSYNVAPSQSIAVIIESPDQKRAFKTMRWGLIPAWANEENFKSMLNNARIETIESKPSFKNPFKNRRCLIIADGYYEWVPKNGKKYPFYFQLPNKKPFAMAGIWELWEKGDNQVVSCAIVTREANQYVTSVHDRMPNILKPKDYEEWLSTSNKDIEALKALVNSNKEIGRAHV